MNWFVETYLPAIVYYLVLPAMAGLAAACALQFLYHRRLQKTLYDSLDPESWGDDADVETEQGDDAIEDATDNASDAEATADEDAAASEPMADEEPSREEPVLPHQVEIVEVMMATAATADEAKEPDMPDLPPGFARPTPDELAQLDPLRFFEAEAEAQEVADPLLQTLTEDKTTSSLATHDAAPQAVEPIDAATAVDDDLAKIVLGSDFDFAELAQPELAPSTPETQPEPTPAIY